MVQSVNEKKKLSPSQNNQDWVAENKHCCQRICIKKKWPLNFKDCYHELKGV